MAHGGDFTMLGSRNAVDPVKLRVESKIEIKHKEAMGERKVDIKSVSVLNRIVTWLQTEPSANQTTEMQR